MDDDLDTRSLRTLRAYVAGDFAEPDVFSGLKDIPREEVQKLLQRHRTELDAIDPARSLILESLF